MFLVPRWLLPSGQTRCPQSWRGEDSPAMSVQCQGNISVGPFATVEWIWLEIIKGREPLRDGAKMEGEAWQSRRLPREEMRMGDCCCWETMSSSQDQKFLSRSFLSFFLVSFCKSTVQLFVFALLPQSWESMGKEKGNLFHLLSFTVCVGKILLFPKSKAAKRDPASCARTFSSPLP